MPDVQKKKKRRHSKPRKKQKQPKPPPQPRKPDIKMLNYGVRVYDLEGRESLQEIINKSKVKAKYNIEARHYTQLIEHFELPTATNHIAMCADNNHLFACGIYPPQICCFELDQLTLKFKRHVDHEVIKIVPLSNDFRKVALLANDRYILLHAQFGHYYKFRIPKVGRDMTYHYPSAELIMVGSSNELYRFSLEQGMFKRPYNYCTGADAANVVKISNAHQLMAVGLENGYVECFDQRVKSQVGVLDACQAIQEFDTSYTTGSEVTALEFDSEGMTLAVGTNKGQVALFDLRKRTPIIVKDHNYEEPIIHIAFHDLTKNIFTTDHKVVKIWDKTNGENFTTIEIPSKISTVCLVPESGMFFVGGERKKIKPLYIPSLGPAPKWCSFVDNITEELEEIKKFTVYQDFKFVTMEELENLGLDDLIGTDMLRPYMHGFFMKMNLYKKALAFNDMKTGEMKDQQKEEIITSQMQKRWNEDRIEKKFIDTITKNEAKQAKIPDIEEEDERFKALKEDPDFKIEKPKKQSKKKKKKKEKKQEEETPKEVKMYEMETGKTISYDSKDNEKDDKKKSFSERLKELKTVENKTSVYGAQEISFTPGEDKNEKKKKNPPKIPGPQKIEKRKRRGAEKFMPRLPKRLGGDREIMYKKKK